MSANVQLGAMTVGDILDRGLKMLLRRFPAVYLINVACQLPVLILLALIVVVPVSQIGILTLSAGLLGLLLIPICTAATLHIVEGEFKGQPATVGAALGVAFARFLPLLGTTILFGLCLFGGAFLTAIPGVMISTPMGFPAGPIVLFVLLFAVCMRIFVWACFYSQVTVVERAGGMYALNRSGKLGRGHGWRIFGVLTLFAVIHGFSNIIGEVIGRLLGGSETVIITEPPYLDPRVYDLKLYAIARVIEFFIGLVISCYISICTTMLYFDLRIRKEGYDLKLAAEQVEAAHPPVLRPVAEDVDLDFPMDSRHRHDDL